MLRLPLTAIVALSAVTATLTSAQGGEPRAPVYAPTTGIEWRYAVHAPDGEPHVQFSREHMSTTMGTDDLPEVAAALSEVPSAAPGESVSFDLIREAGVLACSGSVTAPDRASGSCRFDPDREFIAGLAQRGLVPDDVEDLLGLAFVDARLASIEDLANAGFAVADVDELITVAALAVTGAYAAELRGAGLQPADLDELVSARAVGVEAGWLTAMAEAGYPSLDLNQAIELRALGVTPDYARRMARVMRATEGAE